MIELIVISVFVSLIVGHWAQSWGRDRYEWTALSIFLSPLVGSVSAARVRAQGRTEAGVMSRQPMNTSVREREREERKREFHEAVKDGSLKVRKATAAERRAWKAKS